MLPMTESFHQSHRLFSTIIEVLIVLHGKQSVEANVGVTLEQRVNQAGLGVLTRCLKARAPTSAKTFDNFCPTASASTNNFQPPLTRPPFPQITSHTNQRQRYHHHIQIDLHSPYRYDHIIRQQQPKQHQNHDRSINHPYLQARARR
jgi:hypothetical protein